MSGFKPLRGIVEDNQDPEKIGRVRVRIYGVHSFETDGDESVQTEHLPWAEIIGPTTFGLNGNVGGSSVLLVGTWVWCFLEQEDPNRPIVMGVCTGGGDLSKSAKGDTSDPIIAGKNSGINAEAGEPEQQPSTYGKVTTLQTESGNMIELDDTPGNERVQLIDSAGNYIELKGGLFIEKATTNKLLITNADVKEDVGGSTNTKIAVSSTTNVGNTYTLDAGTNATFIVGGSTIVISGGSVDITSSGSVNITAPSINLN